jgi:hypothetical protein
MKTLVVVYAIDYSYHIGSIQRPLSEGFSMKITHVVLHTGFANHGGFAKVHYSDGGKLIVTINEALKLASQYTVPIINA